MDILKGNIKSIYFKYLIAAFGGTLIPCIYSVVDVAMVGKYHGPSGPAALAVFAPLWNIIYGLGLLAGIGGSVLFSTMRGSDEKNVRRSNEIFTASLFLGILFSVILEVFICCSNNKLFLFFGADDLTLSMAQAYLKPIQFVIIAISSQKYSKINTFKTLKTVFFDFTNYILINLPRMHNEVLITTT